MSESNILLFFDSDDIMDEKMIPNTISNSDKYTCIKVKLVNFNNDSGNIDMKRSKSYGEGVFSIKKETFISMNGFEPWICAADSDFMNRVYKSKIPTLYTQEVMFYRRLHNLGLTARPDTGLRSILRSKYVRIMRQKMGHGNPDRFNIRECKEISLILDPVDFTKTQELVLHKRIDVVGKLLQNGQPRKQVEPREINYNLINKDKSPKQSGPIKNGKLPPKNRQELIDKKNTGTLSSTSRNMFNNKPNRKLDLPNINVGRDNIRIN
jgi:hypothetical protein